jgi:hypothetical protein
MDTKKNTEPRKKRAFIAGRSRFTELVHYVCDRCKESPNKLGATKLNKALWYIDTIAYCKFGKSISGETAYLKKKFGPVPRHIASALQMLSVDGSIAISDNDHFGYTQRTFISLKPPNVMVFSPEERDLMNEVIQVICEEHTAASISELSHDVIWDAAELGENIPINAVLAAESDDITTQDKAWANKVVLDLIKKKREGKPKTNVGSRETH